MLEGGWTMTSGGCSSRRDNDVWWYGDDRCWCPGVRSSCTWAGAHNFSTFVRASGRGSSAAHVHDLDVGDVLQMAFSGSHPDHSMVLTDQRNGDVLFSYHTSDRLGEPFRVAAHGRWRGNHGRHPAPARVPTECRLITLDPEH